ncbi:hypothetical protein LUZ63_020333 [Rhynchospora breviuscula]|uniref:P-type ATPase A domain-containing protein n=1 Tax=Rhynchospora breviuscula TaxID=2022672 RepID=A0A9P9Z943_9POAL|nr:hypothetical protein LUZ63_020333 [Rhynchospora breviuscula]
MGTTTAGVLQVLVLLLALAAAWKPLGDHLARTLTGERHLRVERWCYRALGVDPAADQRWTAYARSVLAFSVVGVVALYALQRLQGLLPLSLDRPAVSPQVAFNTAVSFVTNTNWQAYSGEATMGHLVQMAGLGVQNFCSAAVGICVAGALVRGLARRGTDRLGNFWVDLVRVLLRVLLPLAVVAAVVLMACGVVQNLSGGHTATTLLGQAQHLPGGPGRLPGGDSRSWAPTAAASTTPTPPTRSRTRPPLSNLVEVFCLLVIPVALTPHLRHRRRRPAPGPGRPGRHGRAVGAVVLVAVTALELHHPGGRRPAGRRVRWRARRPASACPGRACFAVSTTGTSTGAVNSAHSSYGGVAGGLLILTMGLGEVAPGGVGSGLYGMLVLAVLTVFVLRADGGPHPGVPAQEGHRERDEAGRASWSSRCRSLVLVRHRRRDVVPPAPRASMLNDGPARALGGALRLHVRRQQQRLGPSPGSPRTPRSTTTALGLVMLLGRFVPIVLVLALAAPLRPPEPRARERGHPAHPRPAFRRLPHRRGRGGRRADLLPARPRASMVRSPVMFVVEVGAAFATVAAVLDPSLFAWSVVVLAVADRALRQPRRGPSPRVAAGPRPTRCAARGPRPPRARLRADGGEEEVAASDLTIGDLVVVEAGGVVPGDGDVVEGAASVDESAITGESAPVIRESGGDRSSVTGGTTVLSDRVVVRITTRPGESFLDTMIALVEGAARQKTPNEVALSILLSSLTIVFLVATVTLQPFATYLGAAQPVVVLVALLVCLIPTTIGALLSAIGIAGMDRLVQHNVLAMSGRAVEAAGDVDNAAAGTRTGTITLANRRASDLVPATGVAVADLAEGRPLLEPGRRDPPRAARSSSSPVRCTTPPPPGDDVPPRAGAVLRRDPHVRGRPARAGRPQGRGPPTVTAWVRERGGTVDEALTRTVDDVSAAGRDARWSSPSSRRAAGARALGVVHLKDVVKPGMREALSRRCGPWASVP